MKITNLVKNSALATTVAALIFGIACSSAQAGKPASHANKSIYLQDQNPSPGTGTWKTIVVQWYEPPYDPGSHEDFGS
jgi:hypothetical protein